MITKLCSRHISIEEPLFLLDERVGNGLHAVEGANDDDGRTPADYEAELPGVLRQLVGVVGVSQVLDGVVQDEVEKWIEAF